MEPISGQIHNTQDVKENKLLAALSYVWVVGIIVLFLKKDSAFVQFHAKQSVVITLFTFLGMILFFLYGIIWLVAIVLYVVGFIKALNGEWWSIPLVSDLAKKIKV